MTTVVVHRHATAVETVTTAVVSELAIAARTYCVTLALISVIYVTTVNACSVQTIAHVPFVMQVDTQVCQEMIALALLAMVVLISTQNVKNAIMDVTHVLMEEMMIMTHVQRVRMVITTLVPTTFTA